MSPSPLATKSTLTDAQRLNRAAAQLPVPPATGFPSDEQVEQEVKQLMSNHLELEAWEECANVYHLTAPGEVALKTLCKNQSFEDLQRVAVELDELARRKYRRRLFPVGMVKALGVTVLILMCVVLPSCITTEGLTGSVSYDFAKKSGTFTGTFSPDGLGKVVKPTK